MSLFTRAAAGIVSSLGLCLMVTGCAADRHEDIPKSAPMVAKGEKDLTWQAPSQGDVYVYDQTEGKMLYSGRVEQGDTLAIDAMEDRILLDGRTVMDKQIRDHNEIEIFFRRNPLAAVEARQARDARPVENRIVVEQGDRDRDRDRDANGSRIVVEPDRQDRRDRDDRDSGNRVIVEPAKEGDTTIRVE